jgi:glycosyltransferase involved in cell wall biosynthesis
MDVAQGSGTFVSIGTLESGLRARGAIVETITPKTHLPNRTAERLLFNRWIQTLDRRGYDASVGFDLDGYRIGAAQDGPPHVAAIKGVIADEMVHERGLTRMLLGIEARCEKRHVRTARLVTTPSRYSAARIAALYGVKSPVAVVPEAIDLGRWRELFDRNPAGVDPRKFTVLCICHFYPRKRIDVLLRAASLLRKEIPNLAVRIIGSGPEETRWRTLAWDLGLDEIVEWLGTVDQETIARELQKCDLFCLPSVQEGFGLVLLEAMAAAKPIVATKAGAVPEVAPHALLAEPDDAKSLAHQVTILYTDPKHRISSGQEGYRMVADYDVGVVSRQFLDMLESVLSLGQARA